MVFIDVPEDIYVDLGVAAAGWAKQLTSARTIGIYQPTSASVRFTRMVQEITARYSYRPIQQADYKVVCGGGSSTTSISQGSRTCSMNLVEGVMQFNSVRMTRDSGFVGAGITMVPHGANKSETTHYCVSVARTPTGWKAVRSYRITEPSRCPRGWG